MRKRYSRLLHYFLLLSIPKVVCFVRNFPRCSRWWRMHRHCSRLWHYFLLLIAFGKFLTTTGLKNRRCERRPYFLLLTGQGLVFPHCYQWWCMRRSCCRLWPYFLLLNAFGKFLTTTGLRIRRRRENLVFMGRK
jgi:hypothetical protein